MKYLLPTAVALGFALSSVAAIADEDIHHDQKEIHHAVKHAKHAEHKEKRDLRHGNLRAAAHAQHKAIKSEAKLPDEHRDLHQDSHDEHHE